MSNPTVRRAWLNEVAESVGDGGDDTKIEAAYKRVKEEGPALGRSTKWKGACGWLVDRFEEIEPENTDSRQWAVLQGFVWIGYEVGD